MSLRILIADDQKIMREGLRSLLEKSESYRVVGEAENGRKAVTMAEELKPDIVIMDISMPDLNGIEATSEIVSKQPHIKVIALSMYPHRKLVLRMLKAGASAYILKDCAFDELDRAILSVNQNKTYLTPGVSDILIDELMAGAMVESDSPSFNLTPREREIVQLIAEGKTTKEIAADLNVSEKTVAAHRQNIMEKLDRHSIAELTKYAIREGLTSVE